jgi:tRNA(Ile)-lysidine synthase
MFEQSAAGMHPPTLQEGALTLRPRAGRERMKMALNRPSRSLKNLFQEAGVPAWQRDWLPLLYLDDELVFAAGLGLDARHVRNLPEGMLLHWRADWE